MLTTLLASQSAPVSSSETFLFPGATTYPAGDTYPGLYSPADTTGLPFDSPFPTLAVYATAAGLAIYARAPALATYAATPAFLTYAHVAALATYLSDPDMASYDTTEPSLA